MSGYRDDLGLEGTALALTTGAALEELNQTKANDADVLHKTGESDKVVLLDDTGKPLDDFALIYSGFRYYPMRFQNKDQLFIQTNINAGSNVFFELKLEGNGYSSNNAVNAIITGYNYPQGNTIGGVKAITNNPRTINVFLFGGKVCFHITNFGYYEIIRVALATNFYGYKIESITDDPIPPSGVTLQKTIVPKIRATQQWVQTQNYLTSVDLNGYALESWVSQQIANLVDSSPAALDTLNELAAALGDDPNFSTTVLNQLAEKALKTLVLNNGTGIKAIGDLSQDRTIEVDFTEVATAAQGVKADSALQSESDPIWETQKKDYKFGVTYGSVEIADAQSRPYIAGNGTTAIDANNLKGQYAAYLNHYALNAAGSGMLLSFIGTTHGLQLQSINGSDDLLYRRTKASATETSPGNWTILANQSWVTSQNFAKIAQLFSGNYNDLTNKPSLFSDWKLWTNGIQRTSINSGQKLEFQDGANIHFTYAANGVIIAAVTGLQLADIAGLVNALAGKADNADIPTNNNQLANGAGYALLSQLFSGNYNDLANLPTIPTNNNQLTNGKGYITASALPTVSNAGISIKPLSPLTKGGQFNLNQSNSETIEIGLDTSEIMLEDLGNVADTVPHGSILLNDAGSWVGVPPSYINNELEMVLTTHANLPAVAENGKCYIITDLADGQLFYLGAGFLPIDYNAYFRFKIIYNQKATIHVGDTSSHSLVFDYAGDPTHSTHTDTFGPANSNGEVDLISPIGRADWHRINGVATNRILQVELSNGAIDILDPYQTQFVPGYTYIIRGNDIGICPYGLFWNNKLISPTNVTGGKIKFINSTASGRSACAINFNDVIMADGTPNPNILEIQSDGTNWYQIG